MTVLLVAPNSRTGNVYKKFERVAPQWPPLGLGYLASYAQQAGYGCQIVDLTAENLSNQTFADTYIPSPVSSEKTVVGIYCIITNYSEVIRLVHTIKNKNSTIIVVLGGPFIDKTTVSFFTKKTEVDYFVIGEGEVAFSQLLGALDQGQLPNNIPGLTYRHGFEWVSNPAGSFVDNLDSLPKPARHLMPALTTYRPYIHTRNFPIGGLIT
ncbi:MAG: cobalamin B12-binding domain-containing protein [Deltaproteobacteria bacterium]|nr:cobalamin B12-binding domain-containing protein [Deltaproteobacteria bacterium]